MKHLVLTPDRNTQSSDYNGAFKPEAERYARFYTGQGDTVVTRRVDVSEHSPKKRLQVLSYLAAEGPIDRLALFCHGWSEGVQFGLKCGDAEQKSLLAEAVKGIVAASTANLKVALYCCLTASNDKSTTGDGSFADILRDYLCAAGRPNASVFGHTTAGHTTRNSDIRMFFGYGRAAGGDGGADLVQKGTPEAHKLYDRLHDGNDTLRWRLPYMDLTAIPAELK